MSPRTSTPWSPRGGRNSVPKVVCPPHHHFWRLEAELKESARPVPPETSVFGEWTAVSSLRPQLAIPVCVCGPASSSCADPSPVGSGPTLVMSFHLHSLFRDTHLQIESGVLGVRSSIRQVREDSIHPLSNSMHCIFVVSTPWSPCFISTSELPRAPTGSHAHQALGHFSRPQQPRLRGLGMEGNRTRATESWGAHQRNDLHEPRLWHASPVAQLAKNPPASQETPVRSLGREDPLEKETAMHSNILGPPW